MIHDSGVRYKVKVKNIERAKNYNTVVERVAMIVREIDVDGNIIDIPSPFSRFAIDMADKLNTQRAYANVFCGFLNYIQKEVNDGNSAWFQRFCWFVLCCYHVGNYRGKSVTSTLLL